MRKRAVHGPLPESEKARDGVVLIPLYHAMTAEEQERVDRRLEEARGGNTGGLKRTVKQVAEGAHHCSRLMGSKPGLNPARVVRLIREAVGRCGLDLSGTEVLTEAATGPYAVTPVIAGVAGAKRVYVAGGTSHGSVEEVTAETMQLAQMAGVADKIEILTHKRREEVSRADILTNSGHVRPIDSELIGWMKAGAVIPLMYEKWEFRASDLDLAACRAKGIPVVGTNERHPAVDVFSYLGMMAVKLLADAGVAVYRSRILLLCDNPFESYIRHALMYVGGWVVSSAGVAPVGFDGGCGCDCGGPDAAGSADPGSRGSGADSGTLSRCSGGAILGRCGPGGVL